MKKSTILKKIMKKINDYIKNIKKNNIIVGLVILIGILFILFGYEEITILFSLVMLLFKDNK